MVLKELYDIDESVEYYVFNSMNDEIFPCISLPLEISEEGEKRFESILALEVIICDSDLNRDFSYVEVKVKTDTELKELRTFMYAQAGHINVADYKKWFGSNKICITKIVIRGSSGWCIIDEAYHDKIAVTADGISYEYKPSCETEINPSRKWHYKTTSPIFKKLYADLLELMPTMINRDPDLDCTDVGGKEFILTYSDGTKFNVAFFQSGDEFKDCFRVIKQMVPACEYVPAVLITEDDYISQQEK